MRNQKVFVISRKFTKRFFSLTEAKTALKDVGQISKWTKNVNVRATTPESQNIVGQLNSLINYYNKDSNEIEPMINFQSYGEKIATPGLVMKVQENYKELMEENYNSEEILTQVLDSESGYYREMNAEFMFHTALWSIFYTTNLNYLEQLRYFPGFKDLNELEKMDYLFDSKVEQQRCVETHNTIPGSNNDVDLEGYLNSQFDWGRKVSGFFKHPSDDLRGIKATKNVMGR